jgi:inorganic pyrophosphatase
MANISEGPFMYMPNLLHVLPPYANDEKTVVNGLVEINAGGKNKYEFITETGHLKLDRVNYSSLTYTTAYGAIPQTWDQDGDLLDFIIADVTEPLVPGCLVEGRIIGVMRFEDGGEVDDKIVLVLNDDKRVDHIKSVEDLGEHFIKETTYYFEHYKDLKKPGTCKVIGFFGVEDAVKIIDEAIERYETDYAPKFEMDDDCDCGNENCEDCDHEHGEHNHDHGEHEHHE